INVPVDQPTIQAGINNSVSGDTVVVAPGEYFENINLNGKNILLTSNFYLTSDYSDIANTIINGSTPTHIDTASVILIISGENASCIIQGFTITGGTGTKWLDEHGAGTYREGGGILITESSPIIRYNYIINNHITNETGVESTGGGGMRCGDSNVEIHNNVIINNEATGYGGGVVFNWCDHAIFKNNLVAYNSGGNDFGGGGLWATGSSSAQILDVTNCTITNNISSGGGPYGGKGGGIYIFTISLNVLNCIIWDNSQTTGNAIYMAGGTLATNYSDIQNDVVGIGNINLDPLFLDTVMCFLIDTLSPCVDAGNPDIIYNDPEDELIEGITYYPSHATVINDIGVYGGPGRFQITDCPEINPQVNINSNNGALIKAYPNPADNLFVIEGNGIFSVSIFDEAGKLVLTKSNNNSKAIIDTSKLSTGIYFYEISDHRKVKENGKFIVE
ncbi:MAG: T9SS type A sorting domain-containing protein, partial [Chitinophagales bacterium]